MTPRPAGEPRWRRADLAVDRDAVFQLSLEYMGWVMHEVQAHLNPGDVPQWEALAAYEASSLDRVCLAPPHGAFYLVECGDALAGMGGLRTVAPGVAELKRVYTRPAHRGRGLGQPMLRRLVDEARALGCHQLVLDTGPFMHDAQRLYEAAGFVDGPAYPGTEVPLAWQGAWRFMQRRL